MTEQHLTVREMQLADVGIRIDYFHDVSDDHLHILDATQRQGSLGVQFVKKSTEIYFKVLELECILCEPNQLSAGSDLMGV